MTATPAREMRHDDRRSTWAALLLGFAMGGFADGILFHQILQWHHLLSNVRTPAVLDPRVQILADGLFHVLMYLIAAFGLWMSWTGRGGARSSASDRAMLARFVIGFGVWQIVDTVVFHWILRIHHVRITTDSPLAYDLGLLVIGIAITAAGWRLLPPRGGAGGAGEPSSQRGLRVIPTVLVAAVTIAGPVAALPPAESTSAPDSTVAVLFLPGTTEAQVIGAIAAVDGRIVWSNPAGDLWMITLSRSASRRPFYRNGALFVADGPLVPGGCWAPT
jgi:uncharacterized membrane protein